MFIWLEVKLCLMSTVDSAVDSDAEIFFSNLLP